MGPESDKEIAEEGKSIIQGNIEINLKFFREMRNAVFNGNYLR